MASAQVERFHRRVINLQNHHEHAIKRHLTVNQNYVNSNRALMDSLISHLSEGDKKCKKTKRMVKPRTSSQVANLSRCGDPGNSMPEFAAHNHIPGSAYSGELLRSDYTSTMGRNTRDVDKRFQSLGPQYFNPTEPIFPPPAFGEQCFTADPPLNSYIGPDVDSWTLHDRHPFDIPNYNSTAPNYSSGYPLRTFDCNNAMLNSCRSYHFPDEVDRETQNASNRYQHASLSTQNFCQPDYGNYWYNTPAAPPDIGAPPNMHMKRHLSQTDVHSPGVPSRPPNLCNFPPPPSSDLPVFPNVTPPSSSLSGINPILVSTYFSVPNNQRSGNKEPERYRQHAFQVPSTTGYEQFPIDHQQMDNTMVVSPGSFGQL